MTLGIVIKAKNKTIVIVSDKRVTGGTSAISAHGDIVEKIYKVTNKSGLTIAGDAGTAITIIEPFLREVSLELVRRKVPEIPISDTAEIFRKVAVEYYTKWYKDMPTSEWVNNVKEGIIPYFKVLLAGFDMDSEGNLSKSKIIELSSVNRFAPNTNPANFGVIGVTTIAQYLLYRFLYTQEQDEDAVAGLAGFCIQETSSQDDSVGEEFQAASFSADRSFRFYSDVELQKIHSRCAELKTEFQTSLLATPKVKEQLDA